MRPDDELPSLAVVIPCWNAERWVARAIQSVLDQQFPNIELIVVDDGSTDGSLDIVERFKPSVRCETGPNRGACAARNRGLAIASSKYIHFLDADDYVLHGFYHAVGRRLAEHEEEMIVAPLLIDDGIKLQIYDEFYSTNGPREWLIRVLETRMPQTGQVVWLSSFIRQLGGWNESVLRNQDWELNIRAMLHASRITYLRTAMAYYNQHPDEARISNNRQKYAIEAPVRFLKDLWETAQARGYQTLQPNFAYAFYGVAYMAYASGIRGVGDDALCMARQLGFRGHIGSAIHRIFSFVFGLHGKLLLSGVLKGRIAPSLAVRCATGIAKQDAISSR